MANENNTTDEVEDLAAQTPAVEDTDNSAGNSETEEEPKQPSNSLLLSKNYPLQSRQGNLVFFIVRSDASGGDGQKEKVPVNAGSAVVIEGNNLDIFDQLALEVVGAVYKPKDLKISKEAIGFFIPDYDRLYDKGGKIVIWLKSSVEPAQSGALKTTLAYLVEEAEDTEAKKTPQEKEQESIRSGSVRKAALTASPVALVVGAGEEALKEVAGLFFQQSLTNAVKNKDQGAVKRLIGEAVGKGDIKSLQEALKLAEINKDQQTVLALKAGLSEVKAVKFEAETEKSFFNKDFYPERALRVGISGSDSEPDAEEVVLDTVNVQSSVGTSARGRVNVESTVESSVAGVGVETTTEQVGNVENRASVNIQGNVRVGADNISPQGGISPSASAVKAEQTVKTSGQEQSEVNASVQAQNNVQTTTEAELNQTGKVSAGPQVQAESKEKVTANADAEVKQSVQTNAQATASGGLGQEVSAEKSARTKAEYEAKQKGQIRADGKPQTLEKDSAKAPGKAANETDKKAPLDLEEKPLQKDKASVRADAAGEISPEEKKKEQEGKDAQNLPKVGGPDTKPETIQPGQLRNTERAELDSLARGSTRQGELEKNNEQSQAEKEADIEKKTGIRLRENLNLASPVGGIGLARDLDIKAPSPVKLANKDQDLKTERPLRLADRLKEREVGGGALAPEKESVPATSPPLKQRNELPEDRTNQEAVPGQTQQQAGGGGQKQKQELDRKPEPKPEEEDRPLIQPINPQNRISDAEIKKAVAIANKFFNGILQEAAAWIWGAALPTFGLSVLFGAIAGDLLPVIKGWALNKAINLALKTEALKKHSKEIASQIKISKRIKLQIFLMNLLVFVVPIFLVVSFLLLECNNPLTKVTADLSTQYLFGDSVCKYFDLKNIASLPGGQVAPPVPGGLLSTGDWVTAINASVQKFPNVPPCVLRVVIQKESAGQADVIGCDCAYNGQPKYCPNGKQSNKYFPGFPFDWDHCSYGIGLTQWTIYQNRYATSQTDFRRWQSATFPSRTPFGTNFYGVNDFLNPQVSLDLTAEKFSRELNKKPGDIAAAFAAYVGASSSQNQFVAERMALYNMCVAQTQGGT